MANSYLPPIASACVILKNKQMIIVMVQKYSNSYWGHIDNMRDDHFSVKLGVPVTFLLVLCACVTVQNPIWRTYQFKISISHTAVTVTFYDSNLSLDNTAVFDIKLYAEISKSVMIFMC